MPSKKHGSTQSKKIEKAIKRVPAPSKTPIAPTKNSANITKTPSNMGIPYL